MLLKGVKPQTHLVIDLFLFALLGLVAFSAFLEHAISQQETHARFMLHAIHGLAGIAMCFMVGLHLLIHFPWIQSQVPRLFKNRN